MKQKIKLPEIKIGGKRFAHGARGLVETLFSGPTTADGYYKVRANNIRFFNANNTPFLITEATLGQYCPKTIQLP